MATDKQQQWLQDYKDRLQLLAQIDADRAPKQNLFYQALLGGSTTSTTSTATSSSMVTVDNTSSIISTGSNGTVVHTPNGDITVPSSIPSATIRNGSVVLPSGVERKGQQQQLYGLVNMMNPSGFAHLSEDKFVFSYPQENMFMPHWVSIMNLVYEKAASVMGISKLHINSGLRTQPEGSGIDGHMAGIACDVGLSGQDRYTFADMCWGLGIRAIGVGQTFVHIDAGPEGHWDYPPVPTYYGPGR